MNKWAFASVCVIAAAGTAHAQVCRVTPTGASGSNGASWATATSLQSALTNAACSEIWVAAGVYMPGTVASDTFQVQAGKAVYGGFAGSETVRAQRNPLAHPAILSGDIDHNDINADGNFIAESVDDIQGTNAIHVVTVGGTATPVTASTLIDGFVITAGSATVGSNRSACGGGLYCDGMAAGECSPSLRSLVLSGNRAVWGGGMFLDGEDGLSDPEMVDIDFIGNWAGVSGGGLYNMGLEGQASPKLERVRFLGNESSGGGGAVYNDGFPGNSSPTFEDALFDGNHSGYGGAIYSNAGTSQPTFERALFRANVATGNGGAVFSNGSSSRNSSPKFTNVTFVDNEATYGAALNNLGSDNGQSSPTLTNVTFTANHAVSAGGAMNNYGQGGTAETLLVNVVMWGNSAGLSGPEIYNSGQLTIRHSVLHGGFPAIDDHAGGVSHDGGGNVVADPGLGVIAYHGGFTDTVAIRANGSAVDAGDDNPCPGTDQRGVARPQLMGCDIGAYELADLIFADGLESD